MPAPTITTMSRKSNDNLQQASGCSCLMAVGIPVAMAIWGIEFDIILPVAIVLVVLALLLFGAYIDSNGKDKKPSQALNTDDIIAAVKPAGDPPAARHADNVIDDDLDIDVDDQPDDHWDIDDYDDSDDGFDETEPDYWYGDRGTGRQRRSGYRVWVDDDEFHDLKVAFRQLMRLLTKMSHDRKLRDVVLGQARDRDTIEGQYGQHDFLVTLRLLLAKDVVYVYRHYGLDTDMDFDSPEGQLLLAVTLLLDGDSDEPTYKEFKQEILHDDAYTDAIRDTHDEMWQVYRDSNVSVTSEEADDFGLILMLALVARDATCIPLMRDALNQLAEVVAQVAGMNEYISLQYKELCLRTEHDKALIADLQNNSGADKKSTDQQEADADATIDDLDRLVGLRQVKTEVAALKHFIEVNKRRQQAGMKTPTISYHCVFTGNPGTGKTTVARIVARIYKQLGILAKGHLVETDRAGLVGEYLGQTAVKTNKIIDSALDGVLFVDEAYSLVSNLKEDYGKEAIATLLKRMEDDRERLVVILAGYDDEMKQFIESNPGLRSRFNRYIHFEDYTPDELMQIFDNQLRTYDYMLEPQAEQMLRQHLRHCVETAGKDFGNARYVRNLFERTIEAQAVRVAAEPETGKAALSLITAQDVACAMAKMVR